MTGAMTAPYGAELLRALFLCRELAAGVVRHCNTATTLCRLDGAITQGGWAWEAVDEDAEAGQLDDALAQVAVLVLKELDVPEFACAGEPKPEGQQVLAAIQQEVFGAAAASATLPQCVFNGCLAQARRAQDLCVAALVDAVDAGNCFSLFALGASCGCTLLQRCAELRALREFDAAAVEDYDGLAALSEAHLVHFLSSDALTVSAELSVFRALSCWVEADVRERLGRFPDLLARCVRFGQLSLADLTYLMDQTQLVALDRQAMGIVAHAIIQYYMGTGFDNSFGRPSTNRPRQCQHMGAAQPGQPQPSLSCGVMGHNRTHRSVLDAALCLCQRERAAMLLGAGAGATSPLLLLERQLQISCSVNGSPGGQAVAPPVNPCRLPVGSSPGLALHRQGPAGLILEMLVSPTRPTWPQVGNKPSPSPGGGVATAGSDDATIVLSRRALRW